MTSLRALAVLGAIFKKQVRHLTRYPAEFIFVLIIPYFHPGDHPDVRSNDEEDERVEC